MDGITTEEVKQYLIDHWEEIREQIRNRKYKPLPVRRVEIPKPNDGVRNLGIPSVVDRIIEQAIAQRLMPIVEPLYSDYSYGFRPKRKAQQAVIKLLEYLKAGVMVQGKYETTEKGTPQGGNLSPLLSNIMLNELDKELESRGLHFVRYADDCVIAVGSSAAANRVMHTITKWIEKKLGLKVNMTKTKVTRPSNLKYLGFGFWKDSKDHRTAPHQQRNPRKARTSQLRRLLLIGLNRRMPNGTYGGVRGATS